LLVVMGARGQACVCAVVQPTPKKEASEVMGAGMAGPVELRYAQADWDSKVVFDPKKPVRVQRSELSDRFEELAGRIVEVSGEAESAAIIRRTYYRGGHVERRSEETRIYTPLAGSGNQVWVASETLTISALSDPRVAKFKDLGTWVGTLRRLSNVTGTEGLEALRNPSVEGKDGASGVRVKVDIPDSAIAVVSLSASSRNMPESYLAPVVGSDRLLWVVASNPLGPAARLVGQYHPCPSRECQQYGSFTDPPPAGLLVFNPYHQDRSRVSWGSILFVLGGVACIVLATKQRRA
jgi:hypothetical protein